MIDTRTVQNRLAAAGYDPGAIDGWIGPKTYRALFSFMARRDLGEVGAQLGKAANQHFPVYQIDRQLRLRHFLSQTAHESGGYKWFRELWGPTDAQRRYEGRADLGNTRTGDGKRYMGRGILQLTGRANYREVGERLGLALEATPELAENPGVSLLIACDYWRSRTINILADSDDVIGVTRRVNGGLNGIDDRKRLLARAKIILA